MKLLFCYTCKDVLRLRHAIRSCQCGETKGAYKSDGDSAWHNGKGIILAIRNPDFYKMLASEPISSIDAVGPVIFRYKDVDGKVEIRPKGTAKHSSWPK